MNIISRSSSPALGTFQINWNNNLLDIPSDITDKDLTNLLQYNITNFGPVSVTRTQDCSGFKWNIKWLTGGAKSMFKVIIYNNKI